MEFTSDKYWESYLFFLHTSHQYVYMYFDVYDMRVQKLRQKARKVCSKPKECIIVLCRVEFCGSEVMLVS